MPNAPQGDPTPREPMTKDVITKEDGRKLIYYRFGEKPAVDTPRTDEEGVQA